MSGHLWGLTREQCQAALDGADVLVCLPASETPAMPSDYGRCARCYRLVWIAITTHATGRHGYQPKPPVMTVLCVPCAEWVAGVTGLDLLRR